MGILSGIFDVPRPNLDLHTDKVNHISANLNKYENLLLVQENYLPNSFHLYSLFSLIFNYIVTCLVECRRCWAISSWTHLSLLGNRKLNTSMDTLTTRYCRVAWLPSNRDRVLPLGQPDVVRGRQYTTVS
jgi:hypothetical protein